MNKIHIAPVIGTCLVMMASSANAVTFPNLSGPGPDLPDGAISFADAVDSFSPGFVFDADVGGDVPLPPFLEPGNTLGVPDMLDQFDALTCFNIPNPANCRFTSLGVGGSLTVEFVDNRLTGSDNADDDLFIYEIGPDIEDTFVEISVDGFIWEPVGKVSGGTKGVDIDFYGFDSSDSFRFVRLTDDPLEGNIDGETVGADIDAITAISTTVIPVPAA